MLSLAELERLCTAFIELGVKKIRLTGGEPLVRRDILSLIEALGRHIEYGGLEELTLTTNGSQLGRFANNIFDCGVRRINVSLDTLDAEKFRKVTRGGDFFKVMEGIDAAQKAGLKVKLNVVALKDFNDGEIADMIRFAHGREMDITVIETMPLGDIEGDRTDQYLPLSKLRTDLERQFNFADDPHRTGGPARYVKVVETGGRLGFITPMTHNFCETCNRVRLTCTGMLYMCLGQTDSADLRASLRGSTEPSALNDAIDLAIARKPKGHDFIIDRHFGRPSIARHMSVTGG